MVEIKRRVDLGQACGQQLLDVPAGDLHVDPDALHGVRLFHAQRLGLFQAQRQLCHGTLGDAATQRDGRGALRENSYHHESRWVSR